MDRLSFRELSPSSATASDLRERVGSQETSSSLNPQSNGSSLTQPPCLGCDSHSNNYNNRNSNNNNKAIREAEARNCERLSPHCHQAQWAKPAEAVVIAAKEKSADADIDADAGEGRTGPKERTSLELERELKRAADKREGLNNGWSSSKPEEEEKEEEETAESDAKRAKQERVGEEEKEKEEDEMAELLKALGFVVPIELLDFALEVDLGSLEMDEIEMELGEGADLALQREKAISIIKESLSNPSFSQDQEIGMQLPPIEEASASMFVAQVEWDLGFVPPQVYQPHKILSSATLTVTELARVQQHLRMLLHGMKCWRQVGYMGLCPKAVGTCITARSIIHHIQQCRITKAPHCSFPLCTSSRQLVRHWSNCRDFAKCRICFGIVYDNKILQELSRDNTSFH